LHRRASHRTDSIASRGSHGSLPPPLTFPTWFGHCTVRAVLAPRWFTRTFPHSWFKFTAFFFAGLHTRTTFRLVHLHPHLDSYTAAHLTTVVLAPRRIFSLLAAHVAPDTLFSPRGTLRFRRGLTHLPVYSHHLTGPVRTAAHHTAVHTPLTGLRGCLHRAQLWFCCTLLHLRRGRLAYSHAGSAVLTAPLHFVSPLLDLSGFNRSSRTFTRLTFVIPCSRTAYFCLVGFAHAPRHTHEPAVCCGFTGSRVTGLRCRHHILLRTAEPFSRFAAHAFAALLPHTGSRAFLLPHLTCTFPALSFWIAVYIPLFATPRALRVSFASRFATSFSRCRSLLDFGCTHLFAHLPAHACTWITPVRRTAGFTRAALRATPCLRIFWTHHFLVPPRTARFAHRTVTLRCWDIKLDLPHAVLAATARTALCLRTSPFSRFPALHSLSPLRRFALFASPAWFIWLLAAVLTRFLTALAFSCLHTFCLLYLFIGFHGVCTTFLCYCCAVAGLVPAPSRISVWFSRARDSRLALDFSCLWFSFCAGTAFSVHARGTCLSPRTQPAAHLLHAHAVCTRRHHKRLALVSRGTVFCSALWVSGTISFC